MQFIGEWMNARCIANFTYGFRKTIWNHLKSLKVMLTAGQTRQVACPLISIQTLCQQSHIGEYECLCKGVKIAIGTHTRSGSTMLNTPWYAKIDAQELFYFMILPVGGTLIDLAVSMKARLELYTDVHGTLIFDIYDECSSKNHERTHHAEVGYHWLQHKTTDVTASSRSDNEKQE